jgi:hypothetical protein
LALAALVTAVATTAPSLAATRAAGPEKVAAAPAAAAVSLDLHQVPGSYRIAVSGKAPASTPVVLTLLGTVSSDLPDLVLNRRFIVSDAAGNFNVVVSPAGDYFTNGLLTLVASSPSGATLAKSQIVLKAPNAGVSVPNEEELKSET